MLEVNKFNCKFSPRLLLSPKLVNSVFFTDRKKIPSPERIFNQLPKKSAIIFREYDLNKKDREILAKNLFNKITKKNCRFIIAKDIDLALKIKADGVHYSDFDKNISHFMLIRKSLPKNFIFSLAIHHEKSLNFLNKLQPDLIFFSPVFQTSTHPHQSPMGIIKLSRFLIKSKYFCCKIKNYQPKIYALGGINFNNLKNLRKLNLSGFGAIDLFKNLL